MIQNLYNVNRRLRRTCTPVHRRQKISSSVSIHASLAARPDGSCAYWQGGYPYRNPPLPKRHPDLNNQPIGIYVYSEDHVHTLHEKKISRSPQIAANGTVKLRMSAENPRWKSAGLRVLARESV